MANVEPEFPVKSRAELKAEREAKAMPQQSRKHIPSSMANLRPQSGDVHGSSFKSGKHKRCHRIKRNGERCKGWAAFGTQVCKSHGARQAAGMPARNTTLREAYRIMTTEDIPTELTRQRAWIEAGPRLELKAQLLKAWQAQEQGDWGPWRALQT